MISLSLSPSLSLSFSLVHACRWYVYIDLMKIDIMIVRGKRDIKPLLLKVGVAFALSLAGYLYSRLRIKRMSPSKPPPRSPRSLDSELGNEADSNGGRAGISDVIHASPTSSTSSCIAPIILEKHEGTFRPRISTDNSLAGFSPNSRDSGDKDRYLLPEFNELVKECDFSGTYVGISPKKDVETPRSDLETPRSDLESPRSDFETPKAFRSLEHEDYEQEIKHLRDMVRILRERERNLEYQLLEYYGLKEQETAVMELQNRLKINNMEAKLFNLKIESLQADNRRLESQVTDYAKVVAELEAARAKIKVLKKKFRSEAEQNKEHILNLQKRVAKLQDQEHKKAEAAAAAAISNPDGQLKFQRLKDLETESEELKKSNKKLMLENSELVQRLESTQILATSVFEDSEAEALKEMSNRLREENEDLEKKIERLEAYRCSDVEELVYLRWINACLRYELRNYQPKPGKTVAKDLSKTLSPESEKKAKKLILEYANTEGVGDKGIDVIDFDSDQWSSSQASYVTDSGDFDDSSADNSSVANRTSNTTSKIKFFSKLSKLIRGKDTSHRNHNSSAEKPAASLEDTMCTYPGESPRSSSLFTGTDTGTDGQSNSFTIRSQSSSRQSLDIQKLKSPTTPSQISSRQSLDIQKLRSPNLDYVKDFENIQRKSDVGSSQIHKKFVSSTNSPQENQPDQDGQKSELVKYALVLRDSRIGTPRLHMKSKSFSSC